MWRFRRAFRFCMHWGGQDRVFYMERMAFGWKYSPLFCHTVLKRIVSHLVPDEYFCRFTFWMFYSWGRLNAF